MKILVVEDNPINQKLVMRLLTSFGFDSDLAENGVRALDMLKKVDYPIVLMDIQMPEMDGLEATRKIRTEFPSHRQPKIIAITANALVGDRERFLAAGMDDYISKPLKVDELKQSIRHWVQWQQQFRKEGAEPMTHSPSVHMSARLQELERETDRVFTLEMIDMYLGDAPKHLQRIQTGFAENDQKGIMVSAHTLKGSSLNIGAEGLGSVCRKIEELARAGSLATASELLPELLSAFDSTCAQLNQYKVSLT